MPGDAALTVSLGMVAPTIGRHGTEEQKKHWLPLLFGGQQIACQLFSEPGAGSDLAAVRTQAVRDGEGWRVSGQKVWTSGAHLADVGEIICRTASEPRHRNLTAFLIDMRAPGVTVRPLRQMTGGASFNEVFLDDVAVSDDRRLDEAGNGWKVALTTLSHERNAMATRLSVAQASYRPNGSSAWSTPRANRPIPSSGRSSASCCPTCAPPGTPGR